MTCVPQYSINRAIRQNPLDPSSLRVSITSATCESYGAKSGIRVKPAGKPHRGVVKKTKISFCSPVGGSEFIFPAIIEPSRDTTQSYVDSPHCVSYFRND